MARSVYRRGAETASNGEVRITAELRLADVVSLSSILPTRKNQRAASNV